MFTSQIISAKLCSIIAQNMAFVLLECLLCMLLITSPSLSEKLCPERCACEKVTSRWFKLKCGTFNDPIRFIDEIKFGSIASDIIKLNLSSNHLSNITQELKLPSLRKLDLSRNQISFIENGVFNTASDLKHIDLSYNSLTTLKEGIFERLSSLKQLDISNNPLKCDCDILLLVEQLQNKSVKLLSNPKCTYQKSKKVQYLKKTKSLNRNLCNSFNELEETNLKLRPREAQIVFEGDSLKLSCLVSGAKHKPKIVWSHINASVYELKDISVEISDASYGTVIDSVLYIPHLSKNHSGLWHCQLNSQTLNQTKSLSVIVITNETKYCPITTTSNNKGSYTWPETIVGYTVDLPCQVNILDSSTKAFHHCSSNGTWLYLNTSSCPYVSETTRILEQFSKVNLTLTKVNVYESAMHLKKNYTTDLKIIRDKMDLVYIARTVQNYLEFLTIDKDLGYVLTDIINNVINLPKSFIMHADNEDKTCLKLVKSLETVSEVINVGKPNFAMQELRIKRDSYSGLTCTWYTDELHSKINAEMHCVSANDNWQPIISDKSVQASLQIPASVFQQFRQQDLSVISQRLFVGMYSNNNFFPTRSKNGSDSYAAVVGTKFVGLKLRNLSNPIYIMLHISDHSDDSPLTPVWWNPKLNHGSGAWTPTDCQVSHLIQNMLLFHCKHLSYYTVLQRKHIELPIIRAKFRISHPAVYIGAFVLFTTLITSVVTYLLFHSSIQIAKKSKHSLVNTWIAVTGLCFMYTFGIYQTEELRTCRIIGLVIHYLTISTLLWMYVTINDLYKRLNRSDNTVLSDEVLQNDPPIEKPILGVYLIGWGISLIVCGISGAVNIKNYSSGSFCFLETTSALSAVFVPGIILILIISICLVMVRCSIRTTEQVTQLSEGTQVTENVDIELLESNIPSGRGSVKTSSTRSSLIEDSEHAPLSNLKANIISFLVFLIAWFFGAFATSKPLEKYFAYEEDLFNILYALATSCFGIFNLFFYCIARQDVRTKWSELYKSFKRKQNCFRNRSISDTNRNPISSNQVSVETQITSRSSSRSSSQPKSASRHSNNFKANDLNTSEGRYAKNQNVDLLVLHRQQYRTNNTVPVYELSSLNGAELFYNPHQSGVARKFFRKQRRNMMKHNNLGTRRRDIGSLNSVKTNKSNSDVSSNIFGTSSKVNNTNIHVEQITENKQKNPNILSGILSESDFSTERLELPVKLLNSRKCKKSKSNIYSEDNDEIKEDNMRTISQQCSLEYSSETLSERILDKDLISSVLCEDDVDYKRKYASIKGAIYVNPLDVFPERRNRGCSLRSSVSTSDFDELYAQMKCEPLQRSRSHTIASLSKSEDKSDLRSLSIGDVIVDNVVNSFNYPDNERTETRV